MFCILNETIVVNITKIKKLSKNELVRKDNFISSSNTHLFSQLSLGRFTQPKYNI